MRVHSLLLLCGLALAGCTRSSSAEMANPDTHCAREGHQRGSEGFATCVDTYIAQVCTARGHEPGGQGYARCEEDLRQATFLRQQLQLHGF